MIRHTTQIMGSQVVYWERNPDARQTLVLVHGFRGNHKALTRIAQELNEFRLILIDLPGYGESSALDGPHTLQNYAKVLEEFCGQVCDGEFDMWGHSYGGTIAILFASQTKLRLRKLVLVTPGIRNPGIIADLGLIYYRLAAKSPASLQRFLLASPFLSDFTGRLLIKNVSPKRANEMLAAGRQNLEEFKSNVVIEGFLSFYQTDTASEASQITWPTLVIAGKLDAIVSVAALQQLAASIPDGQITILSDTGHLAPLEEPGHVATLTREFLAG